jgi:hypothetical protein
MLKNEVDSQVREREFFSRLFHLLDALEAQVCVCVCVCVRARAYIHTHIGHPIL